MTYINISEAKKELFEINQLLDSPVLLVGGIAVQYYDTARDSADMDLVCDREVAKLIVKKYDLLEWIVKDENDDEYRPSYTMYHKEKDGLVIKFGPKMEEGNGYKFIKWDECLNNAKNLTYKNEPLDNILIPSVTMLAYMKLISFLGRGKSEKRIQDINDFSNLTNINEFSISELYSIINKNEASNYIGNEFLKNTNTTDDILQKSSILQIANLLGVHNTLFSIGNDDRQESFSRGSSSFITTMLDAVLFFNESRKFASEEIIECIKSTKAIIPKKLFYKTDDGCMGWLSLCESPKYSFYTRAFNNLGNHISGIVAALFGCSSSTSYDFISLGVGDGKKDSIILEELLSNCNDGEIFYYPMDIHMGMIETAARNLDKSEKINSSLEKLKIKPFVGDFIGIDKMDLVYDFRAVPNIFSLLGNTIGNNDEVTIVNTLKGAIKENDFLLLEVNTDQEAAEKMEFEESPTNTMHDFTPLKTIGVSTSDGVLQHRIVTNNKVKSAVSDTVTTMSSFKLHDKNKVGMANTKCRSNEIKLSIIHYYKFDSFKSYIERELGMQTIYSANDDNVGLFLLHKKQKYLNSYNKCMTSE